MMDQEKVMVVKMVYNRFIESEEEVWNDLDENLDLFDYLTDEEMVNESEVKLIKTSKKIFRCRQDHQQSDCMAPYIAEAARAIVDLYRETDNLHPKNRYILCYYCVLSELGLIYAD